MKKGKSQPSFHSNIDAGAWKVGWKLDEQTMRRCPTWTTLGRKHDKQTTINRSGDHNKFTELKPYAEDAPIKSRNTWIQKHMRAVQWVPGPGAYKIFSDFPAKEDVDLQKSKERGPNFSIPRDIKETTFEVKDVKKKINNHNYPHYTNDHVITNQKRDAPHPGPGHYHQHTTIGHGQWKPI